MVDTHLGTRWSAVIRATEHAEITYDIRIGIAPPGREVDTLSTSTEDGEVEHEVNDRGAAVQCRGGEV